MKSGIMRVALLGAIIMAIIMAMAIAGGCATLLGIEDTFLVDGDAGAIDAPPGNADAGGCTGPVDCTASPQTPLCDTASGTCVECLDVTDCVENTRGPLCIAASNTCGCEDHPQCPSEVCSDEGTCVDQGDVIYVNNQSGADGADCGTLDQPCLTIGRGIQRAADQQTVWVRVQGTPVIYLDFLAVSDLKINLVGDRDTLVRPEVLGGSVLSLSSGAEVVLDSLVLQNAVADGSGIGGHGVLCQSSQVRLRRVTIDGNEGLGINAAGCNVTIERSTLRGNAGGGARVDGGMFSIINTIITDNGGQTANVGGLQFLGSAGGTMQFSTIVRNEMINNGREPGVRCEQVGNVNASSNIVADNEPFAQNQVEPMSNCSWTYSAITPGELPVGMGNMPLDCNLDITQRLSSGSPCVDIGDPNASVNVDVDGEPRPNGAGFDVGADEFSGATL